MGHWDASRLFPIGVQLMINKGSVPFIFKANLMLATSNLVDCVAVVKYGKRPWPVNKLFTPKLYRLGFFDSYEEAISWLLAKGNLRE